jgi:hypothetical protein
MIKLKKKNIKKNLNNDIQEYGNIKKYKLKADLTQLHQEDKYQNLNIIKENPLDKYPKTAKNVEIETLEPKTIDKYLE